jgi:hypothetical protein
LYPRQVRLPPASSRRVNHIQVEPPWKRQAPQLLPGSCHRTQVVSSFPGLAWRWCQTPSWCDPTTMWKALFSAEECIDQDLASRWNYHHLETGHPLKLWVRLCLDPVWCCNYPDRAPMQQPWHPPCS